jgi:ADP-heptose:LPS heptosyltransferase
MGDCILTTPAISILKQERPDLSIAIVVEERFAPIFEGNPDVDAILPPDWLVVRRWKPELCINLHGGATSARLTALSGSRMRAGFAHFRHSMIYNLRIPRAQEILGIERQVHTAEHLASAMFYLGAERREIPRARLFAAAMAASPHAVIHPMASAGNKMWPAQRFLEVAAHLRTSAGLEPVFIGGADDDLNSFEEYRTVSGPPLAELKSLIASASFFIGNDSGPAHMAAAFGIPSVVLFGESDASIWGPWRNSAEVLQAAPMESISVEHVVSALERLRVRA